MHCLGVKTLSGTLFAPPLNETGYGKREKKKKRVTGLGGGEARDLPEAHGQLEAAGDERPVLDGPHDRQGAPPEREHGERVSVTRTPVDTLQRT